MMTFQNEIGALALGALAFASLARVSHACSCYSYEYCELTSAVDVIVSGNILER